MPNNIELEGFFSTEQLISEEEDDALLVRYTMWLSEMEHAQQEQRQAEEKEREEKEQPGVTEEEDEEFLQMLQLSEQQEPVAPPAPAPALKGGAADQIVQLQTELSHYILLAMMGDVDVSMSARMQEIVAQLEILVGKGEVLSLMQQYWSKEYSNYAGMLKLLQPFCGVAENGAPAQSRSRERSGSVSCNAIPEGDETEEEDSEENETAPPAATAPTAEKTSKKGSSKQPDLDSIAEESEASESDVDEANIESLDEKSLEDSEEEESTVLKLKRVAPSKPAAPAAPDLIESKEGDEWRLNPVEKRKEELKDSLEQLNVIITEITDAGRVCPRGLLAEQAGLQRQLIELAYQYQGNGFFYSNNNHPVLGGQESVCFHGMSQ